MDLLTAVLSNRENGDSWQEYLQCKVGVWGLVFWHSLILVLGREGGFNK